MKPTKKGPNGGSVDRRQTGIFSPSVSEIAAYHNRVKKEFYEENIRTINPHTYKVDLSDGLYELKTRLLFEAAQNPKK